MEMKCVKALAESPTLSSIPSNYVYSTDPNESSASSDPSADYSIPIVDYALLTSSHRHQRSQAILDLTKACEDWGFFFVVNHGVPEDLMNTVIEKTNEFFNMREEEKQEFVAKDVLDPIRYGSSFNAAKDKVFFWRDFLKVFVHPQFHSPHKPSGYREVMLEYSKMVRDVAKALFKGVSESLGLEEYIYMEKALDLDSSLQIFTANFYPPCPQPELAMGMPPHSDHGLFTLLIHNGIGGLQIQHNGRWIDVNAVTNSFLVNVGDQLEIFSNGKYKSVLHRATVNNKATRISVAITNGPAFDTFVGPASKLLDRENLQPAYVAMKYKEYLDQQQGNRLDGKSCLDRVRV